MPGSCNIAIDSIPPITYNNNVGSTKFKFWDSQRIENNTGQYPIEHDNPSYNYSYILSCLGAQPLNTIKITGKKSLHYSIFRNMDYSKSFFNKGVISLALRSCLQQFDEGDWPQETCTKKKGKFQTSFLLAAGCRSLYGKLARTTAKARNIKWLHQNGRRKTCSPLDNSFNNNELVYFLLLLLLVVKQTFKGTQLAKRKKGPQY